jgi:hypothetical protein
LQELLFVCFLLFCIVGTVFWVWMVIDCATNESRVGNNKAVWIIIMCVTQIFGAVLYYFVRRRARMSQSRAVIKSAASLPTPPAS